MSDCEPGGDQKGTRLWSGLHDDVDDLDGEAVGDGHDC